MSKHRADAYDLTYTQWVQVIDEYVFSERDRALLKRRLLDGVTFERLAEEFELSPRQVKNITYRETERLMLRIDRGSK